MKILAIADFPAPYRVEVFKGLVKEFDIDLFFTTEASGNRNENWYCRQNDQLEFTVLNTKDSVQRLEKCIKRLTDYEVVLLYHPWAKISMKLQRLCIKKKIPYILNADGALKINTSFPKKQIKSYYCKKATLCFAGCKRAIEYFKAYGADESRIVEHPFTSFYLEKVLNEPHSKKVKSELKQQLGLQNKVTFLSVGRFIELKGFDLLLNAWGKTTQEGQLVIVGGGPLEDALRKAVEENGYRNVSIVDYKTHEELWKYYSASDVFLMPTRGDIWGLVVAEAMAACLPVISSDQCTAANELVENGINGYVYDFNDTDELSRLIDLFGNDENLRAQCANNAVLAVKDRTYEKLIERHIKSIKNLLK